MAATIEGWIAYAALRGDTVANDAASAAALVRARDYIMYNYVARFMSGYDENSPLVEEATYEAAKLELAEPGFFSKTYTPDQRKVLTKVGELSWTVVGKEGGADAAAPVSTRIEAMLRPYRNAGAGAFVV